MKSFASIRRPVRLTLAGSALALSLSLGVAHAQESVSAADAENGNLWFVELSGAPVADGGKLANVRNEKAAFRKAAADAGATVKVVAPKVGGAKLADGSMLAADGQLAGTPSVLFDAVAVILSDQGAKALSVESAAIDFVRDAFGHLKAIAVDKGGRALLKTANVGQDAGVVDAADKDAFIAAAKIRQWDREKSVRAL